MGESTGLKLACFSNLTQHKDLRPWMRNTCVASLPRKICRPSICRAGWGQISIPNHGWRLRCAAAQRQQRSQHRGAGRAVSIRTRNVTSPLPLTIVWQWLYSPTESPLPVYCS